MKKINKMIRYVRVILFVLTTLAMADTPTALTDVSSTSDSVAVMADKGFCIKADNISAGSTSDSVAVMAGKGDAVSNPYRCYVSYGPDIFDLLTAVDYIGVPDDGSAAFDACDVDDDGDVDIFDLLAIIDIMD
ncbi:MAG: hypothetical protein B6245_22755 [Desulfobacteraceae bacterium 4572_88]|nr:MAG: hypothetical protein B6245_22755 [Desulfobacteraceae bacterium 4572_88]RLC03483.1 MAG: hypothetical protein DRI57_29070 [Deltaproteobacteria bacterium]